MRYPKTVRYHVGDNVRVEPFFVFCKTNGVDRDGGMALLEKWVQAGDLNRRADGGFDVIHFRARLLERKA